MSGRSLGLARAVGVLLLCPLAVRPATLQQLSLDQMIDLSTEIVSGTVGATYVAQSGKTIYTHYKIQVAERFKGASNAVSDVAIPGGSLQGLRQTYPGVPTIKRGVEYLFFLWSGSSGPTQLIGLSQGLLQIGTDSTGATIAQRAAVTEAMLNSLGRPVADQPVTLQLSDLRAKVSGQAGGAQSR